jgi:hypothetical protein
MMFIRLNSQTGEQMDLRASLITLIIENEHGSTVLLDSVVEILVKETPEEIKLLLNKSLN